MPSGEQALIVSLAAIGIVILIAALLSGYVERRGLPQVLLFLALGLLLGPSGLGVGDITLRSTGLAVIATLALVFVLFSDAVTIDVGQLRPRMRLAALVLGPGTLLPAIVIAFAAWALLGVSPGAAAVLGAALASTDPVLLRGITRRRDLSADVRLALRLESGMNDAVLLPIVVLSMTFAARRAQVASGPAIGELVAGLFVLGPLAGLVAGWIAIRLLEWFRTRFGVRRDYESLYGLGIAFTAFAAAEGLHGSGFLAAFAAGLAVATLDVELCDCFLDYGEATAEMFLLLTFLAFGSSLIWTGLEVISVRTLLFAAVALVVRTLVVFPMLRPVMPDRNSRWLVALLGPRGLSSLLLVLLPVFAGVPGSERLFSVVALVVLFSLVLHGGAIALTSRLVATRHAPRRAPLPTLPPATEELPAATGGASAAGAERAAAAPAPMSATALPGRDGEEDEALRIGIPELRRLWGAGAPVVLLDVRTERSWDASDRMARGAIRVRPDEAVARGAELALPRNAWLVAYCA